MPCGRAPVAVEARPQGNRQPLAPRSEHGFHLSTSLLAHPSSSHLCGGARLPAGRTRRLRPPPFRNFSSRGMRAAPAANARGRQSPAGEQHGPVACPAPFPRRAPTGLPALPATCGRVQPCPGPLPPPPGSPSSRSSSRRSGSGHGALSPRCPMPAGASPFARRMAAAAHARLTSLRPGTGGRSPPAALRALGAARPPRPAALSRAANHRDKLSPAPALARPRPQVAGEVRVRAGSAPAAEKGGESPTRPPAGSGAARRGAAARGRERPGGGRGLPGAALSAGAAMALPDPDPQAPLRFSPLRRVKHECSLCVCFAVCFPGFLQACVVEPSPSHGFHRVGHFCVSGLEPLCPHRSMAAAALPRVLQHTWAWSWAGCSWQQEVRAVCVPGDGYLAAL